MPGRDVCRDGVGAVGYAYCTTAPNTQPLKLIHTSLTRRSLCSPDRNLVTNDAPMVLWSIEDVSLQTIATGRGTVYLCEIYGAISMGASCEGFPTPNPTTHPTIPAMTRVLEDNFALLTSSSIWSGPCDMCSYSTEGVRIVGTVSLCLHSKTQKLDRL